MNSVFSFNKYKIFFIFGCWLLPKKFSFCPKNNGFARVLGAGSFTYANQHHMTQLLPSIVEEEAKDFNVQYEASDHNCGHRLTI